MDDLYNPLELTRRATRALGDAIAMGGDRVRGFNATQFLETLAGRG
jgi:succinyl-CoA synthetase alpha subunit